MLVWFLLVLLFIYIFLNLFTNPRIEYDFKVPMVAPTADATKMCINSALEKMCKEKGYDYDSEKMLCLHNAKTCAKLNNWVPSSIKPEEQKYYIWDIGNEICHMGPILSRKYCDSKPDFRWDENEHRCHVTEAYCKKQGVDWDDKKKDCYESGTEGFFEGILGKTVVRSIHKIGEGRSVCNIPKSEQSGGD